MKKKLIDQLCSDLLISQFKYENNTSFYTRLLYSALADWMKICILDHTNEKYVTSKSKLYIHRRCSEILDNFLLVFPECHSYFWEESDNADNHPINTLRNKMIETGELINIDNKIYLPETSLQSITKDYSRVFGIAGLKEKSCGITKIKQDFKDDNKKQVAINSGIEYRKIFRSLKWEIYDDYSSIEVLDPRSTKPPYKSWKDIQVIKDYEIYLSRIDINQNKKMFFWIKKENGKIQISQVNDILISFQEIRRFILWQRKEYQNPIKAIYCKDKKYASLKLFTRIPTYEQNILNTYGWPSKHIQSEFEYVFPVEVWNEIANLLISLNFELQEERYG